MPRSYAHNSAADLARRGAYGRISIADVAIAPTRMRIGPADPGTLLASTPARPAKVGLGTVAITIITTNAVAAPGHRAVNDAGGPYGCEDP